MGPKMAKCPLRSYSYSNLNFCSTILKTLDLSTTQKTTNPTLIYNFTHASIIHRNPHIQGIFRKKLSKQIPTLDTANYKTTKHSISLKKTSKMCDHFHKGKLLPKNLHLHNEENIYHLTST